MLLHHDRIPDSVYGYVSHDYQLLARCLSFFTFLLHAWLQFVIRFVFPPASSAAGWSLWGMSLDSFAEFSFWVMCLLALEVLVHIMLHWSWVCGVVSRKILRRKGQNRKWGDGEATLIGVGLLAFVLVLLGSTLGWAILSAHGPMGGR
ncbi:MAG: hypothetical protein H8E66_00260 [Planctomycetes bacterium]|jgi:hypothetical protein|nr:hypothetical protein [Planctomycetota bacterium]